MRTIVTENQAKNRAPVYHGAMKMILKKSRAKTMVALALAALAIGAMGAERGARQSLDERPAAWVSMCASPLIEAMSRARQERPAASGTASRGWADFQQESDRPWASSTDQERREERARQIERLTAIDAELVRTSKASIPSADRIAELRWERRWRMAMRDFASCASGAGQAKTPEVKPER